MNNTIKNEVLKLIVGNKPNINLDDLTTIENCGLNSLETLKMIVLIEEKYNISFEDKVLGRIQKFTMRELIVYVTTLINENIQKDN